MKRIRAVVSRILRATGWLLLAVLPGPLWVAAAGDVDLSADWRTARRDSAGLAPPAASFEPAVVQVYAGRAFGWRGLFAVHTWIATKTRGARTYTVYQVLGWHRWAGRRVVDVRADLPDRYWYGAAPRLLNDVRGADAAALIPRIEQAVRRYPDPYGYRMWPGPNSNTFIAAIGRAVPELGMALPGTAIGKDYLAGALTAVAPSGGGRQISLGGILGVLVAPTEGLEINLLGAVFGINPLLPSLTLPGLGRLGAH